MVDIAVSDKIRILHFWSRRSDAEKLIQELAATGVDFEARLVSTVSEYVSALARLKFHIVIADERADLPVTKADQLSLFGITEEMSPGTPFILLCESACGTRKEEASAQFRCMAWQEINRVGESIRQLLDLC